MKVIKSLIPILIEILLLLFVYSLSEKYLGVFATVAIVLVYMGAMELVNNKFIKEAFKYDNLYLKAENRLFCYGVLFWLMTGSSFITAEDTQINIIFSVIGFILLALAEILLIYYHIKNKEEIIPKEEKRDLLFMHLANGLFLFQFIMKLCI